MCHLNQFFVNMSSPMAQIIELFKTKNIQLHIPYTKVYYQNSYTAHKMTVKLSLKMCPLRKQQIRQILYTENKRRSIMTMTNFELLNSNMISVFQPINK